VKAKFHSRPLRLNPKMFWKIPASWLKASSTRNELSRIPNRTGEGAGAAGVWAAAARGVSDPIREATRNRMWFLRFSFFL